MCSLGTQMHLYSILGKWEQKLYFCYNYSSLSHVLQLSCAMAINACRDAYFLFCHTFKHHLSNVLRWQEKLFLISFVVGHYRFGSVV